MTCGSHVGLSIPSVPPPPPPPPSRFKNKGGPWNGRVHEVVLGPGPLSDRGGPWTFVYAVLTVVSSVTRVTCSKMLHYNYEGRGSQFAKMAALYKARSYLDLTVARQKV